METRKPAVPQTASALRIGQGEADPSVVQQLMFNRILASLRLLWVDHVTVTGFDPNTGTVEARLAGVNFVVNVSLERGRGQLSPYRRPEATPRRRSHRGVEFGGKGGKACRST